MIIQPENIIQSPFLYLQTAGSDFSDYSARGVHLRWQFKGILAEQHMPKGNLAASGGPYATQIGFNRSDDFVYLYKARYDNEYSIDLDFLKPPTQLVESGTTRKWVFQGIAVTGLSGVYSDIELRFTDTGLYDLVRSQYNPMQSTQAFINNYSGVLEVQVLNQLLFKACFSLNEMRSGSTFLEIESICVPDLRSLSERRVLCREKKPVWSYHGTPGQGGTCVVCESVEYFRFRVINGDLDHLRLITYDNTWLGYQNSRTYIDKFSLTEDSGEVMQRLENPISSDTQVNGNWPKYNDVDPSSGAFTVSVDNYMDRWDPALPGDKGLREAVHGYLDLSRTDLLAQSTAPSGASGNMAVQEFSYLQILNILATDFHIARMFGLGHIDMQVPDQINDVYIYFAAYNTYDELAPDLPAKSRRHIWISLPTSQRDHRLPPEPALTPVSYGLTALNGSGQSSQITKPGGYTPDGIARFVNINMVPFPHQRPMEGFFARQENFCLCDATVPLLYGLEYRHTAESGYRRPEILHDKFYSDPSGLPETLPIPDQGQPDKPVFTHRETEEGIHHYALYSINWFSRVSPLSNEVATDTTSFIRKPLPPINLMTHLIQKENQLIFTTSAEQSMLNALPGPDKSLARVTFEWNQTHNDAYQFADQVEFFIRRQPPLMVRGKVVNVQNLSGNQALVSTGPYSVSSSNPPQTIQPNIPSTLAASFPGGIMAIGSRLYEIVSINSTGNNPSFIVKKILQRNAIEDPADPGSYIMSESYTGPSVNEFFTANQNLTQPAQWDAALQKKIKLEKFFPLQLSASSDPANNKRYTIQKVAAAGSNTEIFVKEAIPNASAGVPGTIAFKKYLKYYTTIHSQQAILIDSNLSADLSAGNSIELVAAGGNSGSYTVSSVSFGTHFTRIELAQPLPDTSSGAGVAVIDKLVSLSALNGPARKFIVPGLATTKDLVPAYREFYLIDQGENVHEFVIGGIDDTADVTPIPDPVTGLPSGAYEITLDNFVLTPPADPETSWYKGSIRIEEDPANFPPPSSANYRQPDIKVLTVWSLDLGGSQTRLVAYDPGFDAASPMSNPQTDYMPVRSGSGVRVNVHPGYRSYLTQANSNPGGSNPFRAADLLPAVGEGTRRTLLSARSLDSGTGRQSAITAPVVLLAQEIVTPEPPGVPTGPIFATRPDVYGKSTYTFDMNINTAGREPYAVVCYRANIRKVLSALYLPATVETILSGLETLPVGDAAFFNDRYNDLVNVDYDTGTNQFRAYVPGGYRFPVPDNSAYVIPNPNTGIVQKPFNGSRFFGQNFTVTLYLDGNGNPVTESRSMLRIIKEAIEEAFLPLTEQPILYRYIKDGRLTSPAKPKIRNTNGELIVPGNPIDFNVFDPFPMTVKYLDGAQMKVRFSDYTLDGAADTHYFYFAVEMNSRFEVSDRSPVTGPVSLVNSMPAEAPAIKELVSSPADMLLNLNPNVSFTVNDFIESEKIRRLRIYRATSHRDATSVRTMTLAKELAFGEPVVDDFSDTADLPYAEPLYYRIVALREITNEQGLTEYVPSKPSEIALTNIIDILNPLAPVLSYTSDPFTASDPQIDNVVLSWDKTVHNGRYIVFKLNSSGNWTKIHELESNAASITLPLSSTDLASGSLTRLDDSNARIYHHFKVMAVNSSNLNSLKDNVLTI